MSKRTNFSYVESESEYSTLSGRYKVFIVLPVIILAIAGVGMAISIFWTDFAPAAKVFLFMASLLGVGIVCWLVIISIAVIRLFMFHAERINKTTDDILDTLEHKQEKENVNVCSSKRKILIIKECCKGN